MSQKVKVRDKHSNAISRADASAKAFNSQTTPNTQFISKSNKFGTSKYGLTIQILQSN